MSSAIKDSDSELRQRIVGSTQQPNTSQENPSSLLKPDASGNEDASAVLRRYSNQMHQVMKTPVQWSQMLDVSTKELTPMDLAE